MNKTARHFIHGSIGKIEVLEVDHHRNGVAGQGFHIVRFKWRPEDVEFPECFLGIVFDSPGSVAVVGVDRLDSCGVAFANGNSWRGDEFEPVLRQAIKQSEDRRYDI